MDAMKWLPGEGFKQRWPPIIKMDAAGKANGAKSLAATSRRDDRR